jgi:signal transduction histidine kinase
MTMGAREGSSGQPRLGVGIPGMRARLRQFGGDLRIKSGPWGTVLLAFIPARVPVRRLQTNTAVEPAGADFA